jgi:ABC-2 type transport system permease protein
VAETLRVYGHLLRAQIRAQTQYRVSFLIDAASTTLGTLLDLLTVLVIFRVTRSLRGFGFAEVFLIATLAGLSFSIADLVAGNLDRLAMNVRGGLLDTMLVRPLRVLGQLLMADVALRRLGRVIQGLITLAVAVSIAPVVWTPSHVLLLAVTPLFGAVFFSAYLVIGATVAFWWIDSGEFANGFTYGGRDFTAYPVTVYSGLFRRLFAYGLGFAFIAYYPALVLLGRRDPLGAPSFLGWCEPVIAVAAGCVAGALWRFGIRHYRSTGS